MNRKFRFFFGIAIFSVASSTCLANGYQTWVEQIECGKARYKLTSLCKSSGDPETLNQCKSQHLEITTGSDTRKKKLPELSKSVAKTIKEVGGKLQNLFVVNQACTNIDGSAVEIFYYSIGGGSAPYSEAYAVYDSTGKLLEEKDPRAKKAVQYPFERMKTVHSIMPD